MKVAFFEKCTRKSPSTDFKYLFINFISCSKMWGSVPRELWRTILCYLGQRDLANAMSVSQTWRKIVLNNLKEIPIPLTTSKTALVRFYEKCQNLDTIQFDSAPQQSLMLG